ncbi:MAG: TlpA disulfide reductase family protein [Bacteroidales bacterium]
MMKINSQTKPLNIRQFRIIYVIWVTLTLTSCNNELKTDSKFQVHISGQISNYVKGENTFYFAVNRLGQDQKVYYPEITKDGFYALDIETPRKTDFWISYKTNILLPLFKSDSIHIVLDGSKTQQSDFYNSIIFTGGDVKYLLDALAFRKFMIANTLDFVTMTEKMKKLEEAEIIHFMDSIMHNLQLAYKDFIQNTKPNNEIKAWTYFELESYYYDNLSRFPFYKRDFTVCGSKGYNKGFYNFQLKRLPLKHEDLNNIGGINRFANQFGFLGEKFDSLSPETYTREFWDSNWVATIINYTPDVLLKQLILINHFNDYIQREELDIFEMYKDSLLKYVTDSCLLNPLLRNYEKKLIDLNNKKDYSASILDQIKNTKLKSVFDSIFENNRNKILYIDCWATWCSPCRAEMPHSKQLSDEFKNKNVSFIYFCIESDKDIWDALLYKWQQGGQQFYLDNEQSKALKEVLGFQGVPYYILLDSDLTIVAEGSYLRPSNSDTKIEIEKLLNE